uniref:ZU5 domain-containing protein n=1 Tax=Gongylonema pulchrum TaxID=637853 RepID=A0A183E5M7_9BILA
LEQEEGCSSAKKSRMEGHSTERYYATVSNLPAGEQLFLLPITEGRDISPSEVQYIIYQPQQGNSTFTQEVQEPMRKLSPPPSERDYMLGLSHGETLSDMFKDDLI